VVLSGTPRSVVVRFEFAVVKEPRLPLIKVSMFRLVEASDCRMVPASQATVERVPSELRLYFFRWPSQKGSVLTGTKEAS
jgi:hypothetical protein